MNVSSTEDGEKIVARVAVTKHARATQVRELLAQEFKTGQFTRQCAIALVRKSVRISDRDFGLQWQQMGERGLLVSRGCKPGHVRFDPEEYHRRCGVTLVPPAAVAQPPPKPPPEPPPVVSRPETAFELARHLPDLLSAMPPELVVLSLSSLLGREIPTRDQVLRLNKLLKNKIKGLSDEEKKKLLSGLLAITANRFSP